MGTGTKPCTNIDHQKGLLFEFDAGNDYVCLLMYGEKDCKGGIGGYGCSVYSKNSSGDILSYRVVGGDFAEDPSIISTTTSASSATTTFTTSGINPTDTTADPAQAPPPANEGDEDDDPSLSGGAIAGIVIGVVAALAIIGIIVFFLLRRRKKNASVTGPSPFVGAKPATKAPTSLHSEKLGVADKSQPGSPPPSAAKWGAPTESTAPTEPEEPGPSPYTTRPPPGTALAELSGSNQIVELDASRESER